MPRRPKTYPREQEMWENRSRNQRNIQPNSAPQPPTPANSLRDMHNLNGVRRPRRRHRVPQVLQGSCELQASDGTLDSYGVKVDVGRKRASDVDVKESFAEALGLPIKRWGRKVYRTRDGKKIQGIGTTTLQFRAVDGTLRPMHALVFRDANIDFDISIHHSISGQLVRPGPLQPLASAPLAPNAPPPSPGSQQNGVTSEDRVGGFSREYNETPATPLNAAAYGWSNPAHTTFPSIDPALVSPPMGTNGNPWPPLSANPWMGTPGQLSTARQTPHEAAAAAMQRDLPSYGKVNQPSAYQNPVMPSNPAWGMNSTSFGAPIRPVMRQSFGQVEGTDQSDMRVGRDLRQSPWQEVGPATQDQFGFQTAGLPYASTQRDGQEGLEGYLQFPQSNEGAFNDVQNPVPPTDLAAPGYFSTISMDAMEQSQLDFGWAPTQNPNNNNNHGSGTGGSGRPGA